MNRITKEQYEFALNRIEELLPLVTDETPANDRRAVELSVMHYPIGKPTVGELIGLSLEENGITQRQLAKMIGVSPSRVSDYVSGRSEPTLRIAGQLCRMLNIAPGAMLQC